MSCYVKIILNTQQALDCSFRISSLKLIVFSKRLQVFYSGYAINDRVYLLCVILQKKYIFKKKTYKKKERHIRWAILLWYLLMQDIDAHTFNFSKSLFFVCALTCCHILSFSRSLSLSIIYPLINLLITPWNSYAWYTLKIVIVSIRWHFFCVFSNSLVFYTGSAVWFFFSSLFFVQFLFYCGAWCLSSWHSFFSVYFSHFSFSARTLFNRWSFHTQHIDTADCIQ